MGSSNHYKFFKVSKLWGTALVAATALAGLLTVAHADQVNNSQSPQVTVTRQSATAADQAAQPRPVSTTNGQPQTTDSQAQQTTASPAPIINGTPKPTSKPTSTTSEVATPLQVQNGQIHYVIDGQQQTNAFYKDSAGHIYYFGLDGAAYQNRFFQRWGHTYYFNNQAQLATNTWYYNWGQYYYFGPDGTRYTNQFLQSKYIPDGRGGLTLNRQSQTFYFVPKTGVMAHNYFYHNWGHTYYFGPNGARYTNQFYRNWGHTYYFGSAGVRWDNGFFSQNGHLYYYDPQGIRWENRWMHRWGHDYYFKADGSRATAEVVPIGNHYYYFDSQGIMKTNFFLSSNGHLYYFGNNGQQYRNQFYRNWGKVYYFGPDGARYTNQWYQNWGNTYYFGADGARYTNQFLSTNAVPDSHGKMHQTTGNRLYYFLPQTGVMAKNYYYHNWGQTYYFGADGARYTNQWYRHSGQLSYFDQNGVRIATRELTIHGHQYYFNSDGKALTNQIVVLHGQPLYANDQGILGQAQPGWNWAGNGYCYIGQNHQMLTGWQTIDGHRVYLQPSGIFASFNQRVINWFKARIGKLTYSMYGSRTGADGTADCSGSMTEAVWQAGASRPSEIYTTVNLGAYLQRNGYSLVAQGNNSNLKVQYGDIVIWGTPGNSFGANGHVVVVSSPGNQPMCISTSAHYWSNPHSSYGDRGKAVVELPYYDYWNEHGRMYQMVYRTSFYRN